MKKMYKETRQEIEIKKEPSNIINNNNNTITIDIKLMNIKKKNNVSIKYSTSEGKDVEMNVK